MKNLIMSLIPGLVFGVVLGSIYPTISEIEFGLSILVGTMLSNILIEKLMGVIEYGNQEENGKSYMTSN